MPRSGDPNGAWPGAYQMDSPSSAQFPVYTSTAHRPLHGRLQILVLGAKRMVWGTFPVPSRSMSYGSEASSNNQTPYYLQQGAPYQRRQSNYAEVYPSPMSVTVPSMDANATQGERSGPISIGAAPTSHSLWQQQQHQNYQQSPYGKDQEDYVATGFAENEAYHPHQGQ